MTVADVLAAKAFHPAWKHFRRELSDTELLRIVFPSMTGGLPIALLSQVEGQFVAEVDGIPVMAAGVTEVDARGKLLDEVRAFVDSWFSELRRDPGFAASAELVLRLNQADADGRLEQALFGA